MAGHNAFLSNIVYTAGSNRAVYLWDLAAARVGRVIRDAHTRPAHTVCINRGSQYCATGSENFELFLSAATDNCVRLWDTRDPSHRIRCFTEGHVNRQGAVGVAFSPCMRWIAVGSEDRSVTLYDLRQGIASHHLRGGHAEAVCGVAFHPKHPQLASAGLDGRVRFYT